MDCVVGDLAVYGRDLGGTAWTRKMHQHYFAEIAHRYSVQYANHGNTRQGQQHLPFAVLQGSLNALCPDELFFTAQFITLSAIFTIGRQQYPSVQLFVCRDKSVDRAPHN